MVYAFIGIKSQLFGNGGGGDVEVIQSPKLTYCMFGRSLGSLFLILFTDVVHFRAGSSLCSHSTHLFKIMIYDMGLCNDQLYEWLVTK